MCLTRCTLGGLPITTFRSESLMSQIATGHSETAHSQHLQWTKVIKIVSCIAKFFKMRQSKMGPSALALRASLACDTTAPDFDFCVMLVRRNLQHTSLLCKSMADLCHRHQAPATSLALYASAGFHDQRSLREPPAQFRGMETPLAERGGGGGGLVYVDLSQDLALACSRARCSALCL